MLGKIEGRRREWQRMRWLDGITDSMDIEFEQTPEGSEGQLSLACCMQSMRLKRVEHDLVTEQLLYLKFCYECRPHVCTTIKNVAYTCNGMLLSLTNGYNNSDTCSNMDDP